MFSPPHRQRLITDKRQGPRINRQIRISPIRVISPTGEQLGILAVDTALQMAEEQGLDLVEVAPMARPPVCRIMDYGKFKYEEQRQAREARKKQQHVSIKEIKMRPGIEEHDFSFKTRHARQFLEEGNKVKVTLMFRGRQIAYPEQGREVLKRVAAELGDVSKVESAPQMEGRMITMVLGPSAKKPAPAAGAGQVSGAAVGAEPQNARPRAADSQAQA